MSAIELSKHFTIGDTVYRRHWYVNGNKSEWYEPYTVLRLTLLYVFVEGFMEDCNIRLSRVSLEKTGQAYSGGRHHAIFHTAMPPEYVKQTIGYALRTGPRAVLGLAENHTVDELKTAYRDAARKAHPDMGGKHEDFIKIQHAYEALMKGPTLGDILDLAKEKRASD